MKIGFVWDGNYPWDVRVEKICLSLIEAGHEVHMVCRNGRYEPYEEVIDGIHIHRLPVIKGNGFLNSIVNFPFFFNPVWYYKICNLLEKENIDIVIVRDITLSLTTLKAARRRGIPVILDMAEPYPEMIRAQHTFEKMSLWEKIIRNVKVSEWIEKKTLDQVSLVFAMVEESRDRMIGMSIPQEKILIVSNTPMASQVRESHSNPSLMDRFKGRTVFLYIGFLNMYRGIQIAVQSMPKLLEKDDKAILVVVGSGGCEAELKSLARKLGVEKNVFFEGYQHHSKVGDYVASCDVGIIPHFSCGLWNNTIPNKLFDYMFYRKPVLTSDAKPAKRIVEEERCGLVYSDDNPDQFAGQAIKLLEPNTREELGNNGFKAVMRRYNWDVDSKELLRGINRIISN